MNEFNLDWNDEEVKRAVDGACEVAVNEGAKEVLRDAQTACPVEKVGRSGSSWKKRTPGSLKKSGRIKSFSKIDAFGAYVKFGGRGYMVNGVDTYYAPFVELGTPGEKFKGGKKAGKDRVAVKAKPFLREALRNNKAKIQNKFKDKLPK